METFLAAPKRSWFTGIAPIVERQVPTIVKIKGLVGVESVSNWT